MSNENDTWATVVKRSHIKTPTVILSTNDQQRYKNVQKVDPTHDSRFDNVILSKPKSSTTTEKQAVTGAGQNHNNKSTVDMGKIERGEIRLAKSNKELATKIQQYRMAKKWTQEEFNKKCSFPPHTIKGYENMTVIADQHQIDIMKRVLGVNDLHKPKNIKLTPDSS